MTAWRAWPGALAAASLDPDEDDRGRDRVLLGIIVALAIVLRLWLLVSTRLTDPAALITLRFSENIAHGSGFVYNAGERVLGTTTPLFALLMAAGLRVGIPGLALARAIGVAADGALCVIVAAWLRAAGHRRAGLVAAFLLAVSPHGLHWAISGMETCLVTACCAAVLLAFTARRYTLAYAVLGFLFVLRWDTVLLFAVITAAIAVRERGLPLRGIGVFAIAVAPWVIFATLYFGAPIPVTWSAKAVVAGRWSRASEVAHLRTFLPILVGTAWDKVVTAAALFGLVPVVAGRRTHLSAAIGWCGALWAAYVVSRAPITDRYVLPILPVHVALASIAVAAIHRRASAWCPRPVGYALAAAAAIALTWPARGQQRAFRAQQAYEDARRSVAVWLRDHSDPADRVLVAARSSIGYFGYYSGRPILDAKGIVTPVTLPFWGPEHVSPDYDIAMALRPAWCVVRTEELAQIEQGAAAAGRTWEDDYQLAGRFPPPADVYHLYRRRASISP